MVRRGSSAVRDWRYESRDREMRRASMPAREEKKKFSSEESRYHDRRRSSSNDGRRKTSHFSNNKVSTLGSTPPQTSTRAVRHSRSIERRSKRVAEESRHPKNERERTNSADMSSLRMGSTDANGKLYESYAQYLKRYQASRRAARNGDNVPPAVFLPNTAGDADDEPRPTKAERFLGCSGAGVKEQMLMCTGARLGDGARPPDYSGPLTQLRYCTGARPSGQSSLPSNGSSSRKKKSNKGRAYGQQLSKLKCVGGVGTPNIYGYDYDEQDSSLVTPEETDFERNRESAEDYQVKESILRNGNDATAEVSTHVPPDCLLDDDANHDTKWLAFVNDYLEKNFGTTTERVLFGPRPTYSVATLRNRHRMRHIKSRSWDSPYESD